jgi:hypothetical protein
MKNIIKKTVISLSVVSLIMIGFSSFAFAEPRPFEKGPASTCGVIHEPVNAQEAAEIRAGLASNTPGKILVCSVAQPSNITQQLNEENQMGGR